MYTGATGSRGPPPFERGHRRVHVFSCRDDCDKAIF